MASIWLAICFSIDFIFSSCFCILSRSWADFCWRSRSLASCLSLSSFCLSHFFVVFTFVKSIFLLFSLSASRSTVLMSPTCGRSRLSCVYSAPSSSFGPSCSTSWTSIWGAGSACGASSLLGASSSSFFGDSSSFFGISSSFDSICGSYLSLSTYLRAGMSSV